MTEIILLVIVILLLMVAIALIVIGKKDGAAGEIKRQSDMNDIRNKALIESMDRAISVQSRIIADSEERTARAIRELSEKNEAALKEMRYTVDEKLNSTLEHRFASSYNIIAENLNKVAIGIGEVNKLADSIGDIKRVFTNVKVRGTWGEIQLENLLSEMLTKDQYVKNCRLNPAVDKTGAVTYLPIDSKFPIEEYNRLAAVTDPEQARLAERGLANAVKRQADSIAEKYIYPPNTTDFAIMYLPVEGLYAETLKNDDLNAYLHKRRIMACGPTNLGALLNSLQVGFKTVAIENRSRELWQLLAVFRSEFLKFSALLEKTGKKLAEAQESIDMAARRTKTIERKLKNVEELGGEVQTSLFDINRED